MVVHRSTADNDMTCCNMEAGSVEVAEAQELNKVLLVSFIGVKKFGVDLVSMKLWEAIF